MANISQKDSELLAIVRHFNAQRKNVDRLIWKLGNSIDLETIQAMTGFEEGEVKEILNRRPKLRKSSEATKAVAKVEAKPEPKTETRRLAIHINADSDLIQRIAYDMAQEIHDKDLASGEKLAGQKEIAAKLKISQPTISAALKILRNHNWIEYVDESNPRLGHMVK